MTNLHHVKSVDLLIIFFFWAEIQDFKSLFHGARVSCHCRFRVALKEGREPLPVVKKEEHKKRQRYTIHTVPMCLYFLFLVYIPEIMF